MPLELLAPAKDLETGTAAINCGADAVYIGASRFGAREAAGNSFADVESLIHYAHSYWAKVYVVVNTLLYDAEIPEALKLIDQVYQCGADALIIQDTGLLECGLPPIPLFASTQMHNHTPARIAFLEQVGFQRVILARELSLQQIGEIRAQTSLELEAFIHGALCVSYSGQCTLSYAIGGRSGNRGQCAQPCRNLYSLVDRNGQILQKNRHLLSIRDLNLTDHLRGMIEAGVTSFKIEGRLKDKYYVMNVVSHYRKVLDSLGESKTSSGKVIRDFEPDISKTFNRGYCDYFIMGRRSRIGSPDSPKMIGEPIGRVQQVTRSAFTLESTQSDPQQKIDFHNGDGMSFFIPENKLTGTLVNQIEKGWITPAKMDFIHPGLMIYRNFDKTFFDQLKKSKPSRKIAIEMKVTQTDQGIRLEIRDENGITASSELACEPIPAEKPEQALEMIKKQLGKLGETEFIYQKIQVNLDPVPFLSASGWNELRRKAIDNLRTNRETQRPVSHHELIPNTYPFPDTELSYLGNVLNEKAAAFYKRHGVKKIELAAESGLDLRGRKVMTTRYCLKYQLEACPRRNPEVNWQEPVSLIDQEGHKLYLKFDCAACKMEVYWKQLPPN